MGSKTQGDYDKFMTSIGMENKNFDQLKSFHGEDSSSISSQSFSKVEKASTSRTASTRASISSTWSQLFSKRTWIDNGFDSIDFDDYDEEEDIISFREVVKYSFLRLGHELNIFYSTCAKKPKLLFYSFIYFFSLMICGLTLVYFFKENYVQKQIQIAEDLACETGEFYRDELARTVIPLFSLGQIVKHDDDLLALSSEIGTLGEVGAAPIDDSRPGYRNVYELCERHDLMQKFDDIVVNLKEDAQLEEDGIVTNLGLAPQGVFCLNSPRMNYKDFQPEKGIYQNMTDWIGKDWASSDTKAIYQATLKETLDLTGEQHSLQFMGPFKSKMGSDKSKILSPAMYCVHLSVPLSSSKIRMENKSYQSWGIVQAWIKWDTVVERSYQKMAKKFATRNMAYKLEKREKIKFVSTCNMMEDTKVINSEGVSIPRDELEPGNEYTFIYNLTTSPTFIEENVNEHNSLSVPIQTLNSEWTMTVVDLNGFKPSWYCGAIAGVVVLSFILSLFCLIISVEKRQNKDLLYKMMPKKAVQKLNKGKTVVEKFDMVTIFFSDIVGFTTLAGSMRPVEIMKMLNELYVKFDELVEKHKLYKVETIGDAYMVLGGAPNRDITTTEAAEKVAQFALDAIEVVKNLRIKTSSGSEGQIFIRAGLASGGVVAGVVGNAMPRYCLFGDTVNFASRMESTSVKMRIQCCDTTKYLLVDSPNRDFILDERIDDDSDGKAGVFVKGKGWVHTYWIEGSTERKNKRSELDESDTSIQSITSDEF